MDAQRSTSTAPRRHRRTSQATRSFRSAAGHGVALALLAGCSSPATEPVGSGTVQLTATRTDLVPGETAQLAWVVRDAAGTPVPGATVALTSDIPGVAAVSTGGLVTAVSAGTASITARAGAASAEVSFRVDPGGVITAAGATLSSGGITLLVPAGAVSAPTAVRLQTAANPVLDPTEVGGTTHSIAPDNLSFAVPATVRLSYNAALRPVGMLESALRIRAFAGGVWHELSGGGPPAGGTIEAPIGGGGTVSVGWVSPATPCTAAEFHEFDFWIGAWRVSTDGSPVASSDITAAPGGCAILEHWQPNGGPQGRSISFYEQTVGMWYQTYVDAGGQRLLMAGGLNGGAMTMLNPPAGGTSHERWQWTVEGASVRQTAANTTNGGASYPTFSWNAVYAPR